MAFWQSTSPSPGDYSRAIRNLEEAESIFQPTMDRNYFSTLYYLILSLENKYQETLDLTFKENRNKYISSVIKQENAAIKAGFDMTKFHKKFSALLT
ncbi:hypothetical protein ACV1C5_03200 [Aeromonas caviae]